MGKSEVLEKSAVIQESLFNLEEYKKAKTVMFYVSFDNEVFTHDMILNSLKRKYVVVPKLVQDGIEPSLIIDFDNMISVGKFGILEPIELLKVPYSRIDLVLVPGIAFDKNGHRVGYGLGHYDKFLKKVPKAAKIGLCFEFQIIDSIPSKEHDVPLDTIVTEQRVMQIKSQN